MGKARTLTISMAALAVALTPAIASAGGSTPLTHETTVDYGFTGAAQRFRVPIGVDQLSVHACGAEGGTGAEANSSFEIEFGAAGRGAEVEADIPVTPGERLWVRVGGAGGVDGGYNGGGTSVFDPIFQTEGQGGGGASDVRQGGNRLADRVVVAGGGGGGGGGIVGFAPIPPAQLLGGDGGLVGGDAVDESGGRGATQSMGGAPGVGAFSIGEAGVAGRGGSAPAGTGAGGGGLFGGGGGAVPIGYGGGGGGGSSLADTATAGACEGDGWVQLMFEQQLTVTPRAALVVEGDTGSRIVDVPVTLSAPVESTVTAEWATVDGLTSPGLATSGVDFVPAAGTVEFGPGETRATIPIEVIGDVLTEPDLLWGEWGIVQLRNVSANAVLDTEPFFGAALFVIESDDEDDG